MRPHENAKGDTMNRKQRLARILADYEDSWHDTGYADGCTPGERYLLIEENARGGFWLTTWSDLDSAADYHANQEYAEEWTATELLVDLDTDDEYEPGPATFKWDPIRPLTTPTAGKTH